MSEIILEYPPNVGFPVEFARAMQRNYFGPLEAAKKAAEEEERRVAQRAEQLQISLQLAQIECGARLTGLLHGKN